MVAPSKLVEKAMGESLPATPYEIPEKTFPRLPGVVGDELHCIGFYEASTDHTRTGSVDVAVDRPGKKVVLVLTAYEDTHWRILPTDGTKISAVILSGYDRQSLEGVSTATVVHNSSYEEPGKFSSFFFHGKTERESRDIIASLTGMSIGSSQGAYTAPERVDISAANF